MRKKLPIAYCLLFLAILGLMSLPKNSSERLRGTTIALMAPTWQHLLAAKTFINDAANPHSQMAQNNEEVQKLRLENALLQNEISLLKEVMQQEMRILSQLKAEHKSDHTYETTNLIRKRHKLELQRLLQAQLQAIPGRIIFRSPASWNSSVWIDVGTATNETLNIKSIAKNSPVMVGSSVIGIIDYVGKKQSRVRLITDSGLTPSVRAMRTSTSSPLIKEKINSIIQLVEKNKCLLTTPEEQPGLMSQLEHALQHLSHPRDESYLAKGELYGASKPLWRSHRHQLKGMGFNYDFADGEGPARDLRTGKPLGEILDGQDKEITPILKAGDLLVTTGMDGVFPPDLLVAEVTKVYMLKEGDYFYELDAVPTAGNLDELSLVFVLPPVGYDEDEKPQPIGW